MQEEILEIPNVEIDMKTIKSPDLNTYERMLIEASGNKSDMIYPNADKNHAAIAYSVLFNSSTSNVNLVVDCFKGDVSNNPKYVEALKGCLQRGVSFKILCLNKPNPSSKGYQKLLEYADLKDGSVEVKLASPQSKEIIEKFAEDGGLDLGETHNFGLFDNDKYRLEFLPSKYMALLSFNDAPFVAQYKAKFNDAFKVGFALD